MIDLRRSPKNKKIEASTSSGDVNAKLGASTENDMSVSDMVQSHLSQAKSMIMNNPFYSKPSAAEANAAQKLENLKRRGSPAQK